MRGLSIGFQSIFARKALPEAEFSKNTFIDGRRFSHIGLVWDSAHRNPRLDHFSSSQFVAICRISDAAWIGHAVASAAPAASFKSRFHSKCPVRLSES